MLTLQATAQPNNQDVRQLPLQAFLGWLIRLLAADGRTDLPQRRNGTEGQRLALLNVISRTSCHLLEVLSGCLRVLRVCGRIRIRITVVL